MSLGTDSIYSVYIYLLHFLVILIFHAAKNMTFFLDKFISNAFTKHAILHLHISYPNDKIRISIDIISYSFKEITIKYMLLYSESHCYTTVTVINMWVFHDLFALIKYTMCQLVTCVRHKSSTTTTTTKKPLQILNQNKREYIFDRIFFFSKFLTTKFK